MFMNFIAALVSAFGGGFRLYMGDVGEAIFLFTLCLANVALWIAGR